jgi:predicted SnoaL-like aldol condensation-catalyzing enzyme
VHLFRFRGARIVELWDVAMEVPKRSPNRAGAF